MITQLLQWHPNGPPKPLPTTGVKKFNTQAPQTMKKERYKEQVTAARIIILEKQHTGWLVVFTDGSAKQVRGYWQAGFGVFYGKGDIRNVSAHVPLGEKQRLSVEQSCEVYCEH